jgi:hypothetical protein
MPAYRRLTGREREQVERRYPDRNLHYVVTRNVRTTVQDRHGRGHEVLVPKGFLFDGCTLSPDWAVEYCMVHDWLFATHRAEDSYEFTCREANNALDWFRRGALNYTFSMVAEKVYRDSKQSGAVFL